MAKFLRVHNPLLRRTSVASDEAIQSSIFSRTSGLLRFRFAMINSFFSKIASMVNTLLAISLLFSFSNLFAALELELTQGVDNAIPIAVEFSDGTAVSQSIEDVIKNDLKNSGRFRLVNSTGQNDFGSWQAQKIEAVATGQIKTIGFHKLAVNFKLFDVYNSKKLFEKEYQVEDTQLRKLAHHLSDIIYQHWTGDRGIFSTKIAYVLVERQGRKALYKLQVADSDGHNTSTILTSRSPIMSPAWSPDGRELSYVSFEGNRAAIYIQSLASGSRRILTKFPGINGAPAWSKDGRKIALVLTQTGYPKIYILDLATKKITPVTDSYSLDTEPSWSPDGSSLIFTSDRGGSPQIYQVNIASRQIKRVSFNGSYNARAAFTPNGSAIVMLHQEGDLFTIAIQDLKSGRITLLTQSGRNESPSIAPNGKMVVYATNYQGKGVLAEVATDGKVKVLLPARDGEVQEPAWSPFLN